MNRATEPGLLEAVARVGSSVFGMLQNRLELASIELGEARERLVFTLVASFAAVLLLGGAVVALTAWLAAAAWSTTGPAVFGWIALGYGAAGIGLLLWLRARLRSDPPLLADTLAELRTDAAALRGQKQAINMNAVDRHARKQVLLTRIAFERAALRSELAQASEAARLPNLLRNTIGGNLGRSLFGAAGSGSRGGWVGLAWSLLRRYRVAATLLGGAGAILRGRGWRRPALVGGLAAAAYFGWRVTQGRRQGQPPPP